MQDSIPVGCIPAACQPYAFQWPPLDVNSGGGGVQSQVNKFEQVSNDDHQKSLAGGRVCPGGRVCTEGVPPYHVTYPMMHVMLPTPCEQTDGIVGSKYEVISQACFFFHLYGEHCKLVVGCPLKT